MTGILNSLPADVVAERRGAYEISTDPARLELDVVHGFLSTSYWAAGIPRETVRRSIAHSLAFGIHHDAEGQVGFARVISDRTTFAYLCDVFVLPAHAGRGLGGWLVDFIGRHPELQGLRRWMLVTRDAHGLYARHGWTPVPNPDLFMQRHSPGIYAAAEGHAPG
jgi:GNAT superfamily N-acetyltransferase